MKQKRNLNYHLPASPSSQGGPLTCLAIESRRATYQDGVTLLIAIIMLASVTFISFSLATVILREITATRIVLRTEPAISGSGAGSEFGIYQLLRQTGIFDVGTTPLPQSGVSYEIVSDLHDSPLSFSILAGEKRSFKLYDPQRPTSLAADYGSVTLQNLSFGAYLRVYALGAPPDLLGIPVCTLLVSAGDSGTCTLPDPPPGDDDRYRVDVIPFGGVALTGEIDATDNSGQPKGLASSQALEVTGTLGDVERKIRVDFGVVPN